MEVRARYFNKKYQIKQSSCQKIKNIIIIKNKKQINIYCVSEEEEAAVNGEQYNQQSVLINSILNEIILVF